VSIPFGPRLIGETEKTLNALLRNFLAGSDLTEPQWVTLQLAVELDGSVDAPGLADAVAERAHFDNSVDLVDTLGGRSLLDDGRPTRAGLDLVAGIRERIALEAGPIWQALPPDDVAIAERVLNEVVARAREVLARQNEPGT
jgi:hypothetical protein